MTNPPTDDLRHVADAHRRLGAALAGLTDDQARRPTGLPGWTVGHVLTHVARNADANRRRSLGAARGERVDPYPAGRDAEIEAGAGRTAAVLAEDVIRSARELEAVWSTLPAAAWAFEVGPGDPLADWPARRWREVEVHLVDAELGVSHRDWPDAFVERLLAELRPGVPARLPAGAEAPAPGTLDDRDELLWLLGRLRRDGLPVLGPWD